jgi:hypothetical protein
VAPIAPPIVAPIVVGTPRTTRPPAPSIRMSVGSTRRRRRRRLTMRTRSSMGRQHHTLRNRSRHTAIQRHPVASIRQPLVATKCTRDRTLALLTAAAAAAASLAARPRRP